VTPSNLEALVWFLYTIPVTLIYVLGYRTKRAPAEVK